VVPVWASGLEFSCGPAKERVWWAVYFFFWWVAPNKSLELALPSVPVYPSPHPLRSRLFCVKHHHRAHDVRSNIVSSRTVQQKQLPLRPSLLQVSSTATVTQRQSAQTAAAPLQPPPTLTILAAWLLVPSGSLSLSLFSRPPIPTTEHGLLRRPRSGGLAAILLSGACAPRPLFRVSTNDHRPGETAFADICSTIFSRDIFFFTRLPLVSSKANHSTTASLAVTFVSDQDFSLRKTSHIINAIPPPTAEAL
jgi:hypothetical protein